MANETGTASDYRDLLQKLKLFLTGQSVSPIGSNGLNWEVLEERSQSTSPQTNIAQGDPHELMNDPTANDQDHDQIIFRGTGGTSPETSIYFAIQTYGYSPTGYFNWQIRGYTGFTQNSPITDYVSLANQPGRSPPVFLPLQNTTMTYWFVANNRHVKGVVKTGTAYHYFYIGLINQFATETEWPYPMAVFATSAQEVRLFSSNTVDSSGFVHPVGNATATLPIQVDLYPVSISSGYIRFTDGNWYSVKNYSNSSNNEVVLTGLAGFYAQMFPLCSTSESNFAVENRVIRDVIDFGNDIRGNPGATPNHLILQSLGSPQLTTMWPLVIHHPGLNHIMGELDGVYWISAAGGLTSEDTITDSGESPEVLHIAFQNVWRTDQWMFFAMRID